MKNALFTFLFLIVAVFCLPLNAQFKNHSNSGFTENKGQVSDQDGKARPDVLFSCNVGELVYHLRTDGVSYQLSKVEKWKKETDIKQPGDFKIPGSERMVPDETSIYRVDLEWVNATLPTIQTGEAFPDHTNYYLAVCPEGISNVRSFSDLLYKEIYNGIDLHYYLKNGHLKYDYMVASHAGYKQIKIRIKGAEKILLQKDGSVVLQTPLGNITEAAPLVYQGKRQLRAKWILNESELSFSIDGYDPSLPMIIDPVVRGWGTYYGGSGIDEGKFCSTDMSGNVYMAGRSNGTTGIATTGSFKTSLTGTGYDAFLVKFNTAGARQWATYYGGVGDDQSYACAADPSGNIYLTGLAGVGSNGLGTAGSQQIFHGGDRDAFLVKFNNAGARLWGTYYGSTGYDVGEAVIVDPATSDVYMSGYNSGAVPATVITTAGAHQTAGGSAMLVKFNAAGTRLWATVYGNSPYSHALALALDLSGNIYMGGQTDATGSIASPGAHQTTMLGMFDAFLAKFNSAGVRQWGTYYGEISMETTGGVTTDASGNVYLVGLTGSPTGIATPGSHQPVHGTAYNGDGMIVKFNSAGVRQWGTYYGGTTDDFASGCVIAPNGDLYVSGYSQSVSAGTVIATANGLQPANAGYGDGFLAHFTTAGLRVAATYYGESGVDIAYSCAADLNNNIYTTGIAQAGSGTNFPSSGSYQTAFGGGTSDAFLVQFKECTGPASPVNITAVNNLTVCNGGTATLSATSSGTVNWYNSSAGGLSLGTGTIYISGVLNAGTYTFFAEASDNCSANPLRTPVTVTVVTPAVNIISGTPGVCIGESATLTASGAAQYTWNTNSNNSVITITPTATTSYTVKGLSTGGCTATAVYTLNVYSLPTPSISTVNSVFCAGQPATLTANGAAQYSWTTGQTSAMITVTPQSNSSYTVKGTSLEGCSKTATIAIQVNNCTGLENMDKIQLMVFPNPFKDLISISTPFQVELRLMNVLGELIKTETIDPGLKTMDLHKLANGVYILQISMGYYTETIRIIKE